MKIEMKNITKVFKEKKVLNGIDFTINSGEVCGLLGVNGAGKSTLMKILFGQIAPDKGQVLFDGVEKRGQEKIGAMIESPAIYMNLSAFDNLKTKALLYNISDEKIREVLQIIGLAEAGKKKAGKFSFGMKQRMGIGMAILTNPEFLILDEPTNGLDPDGIAELLALIHNLKNQGVTLLISSHQLHEVGKVADKVVILNEGKIVYDEANNHTKDLETAFFKVVHGGI
ncbi:MAG: ABC transporter ATP-binding protein [Streptococcaceae bacterium]|jgi:ABC-2 type transport system ATP-binding protein|nr:ABC transporter ATP-binding protein [Streptococcaceae bacterium]